MWPEQHVYYKRQDQQRTTEVAIRSTAREDLYVLYEGQGQDGRAFFRVYVDPLVVWVWIGAYVLTLGTIITMLPDNRDKNRKRRVAGLPERLEGKLSA